MSAKVFDGNVEAEEVLQLVKQRMGKLGFVPKLVSFYKPDDMGSALYTRIKRRKAQDVGIEFEGVEIFRGKDVPSLVKKASLDSGVCGILVQHPSGEFAFSEEDWRAMVDAISPKKDVDGLREDSPFVPATVKAVLVALRVAGFSFVGHRTALGFAKLRVVVVGATGMVGRPLVKVLEDSGAKVIGLDVDTQDLGYQTKRADVLVSATGVPGLIKAGMVKPGAVVIDVGAPKGDVSKNVKEVASFVTPVPGGIGPVTVACLLENVVEAAEEIGS